jgi:DNA-binding NarL/FixJ family response regulator
VMKLRRYAEKGMAVRAIAKALTRSEESVKARAKEDSLKLAKLR